MNRAVERKVRSDKKRDVKPLISIEVKDAIHRISHVTHTPVKDVCEFLIVYVAKDRDTINDLSKFFRRPIRIDSTVFLGNIDNPSVSKREKGNCEKVSIKFKADDYELVSALAYALDCAPTRASAILLTSAVRNVRAVNEYVKEYMHEELSPSQISELRQLLSYVNQYSDDNHSWMSLLSAIVGDIRPAIMQLRDMVSEFIADKKKK